MKAMSSLHTPDLSRLLAAAVVNPDFRQLLLKDAAMALARGYHGTLFRLTAEEQNLVLSIQASSLADFAAQLTVPQNGHANGHNGYHFWPRRAAEQV